MIRPIKRMAAGDQGKDVMGLTHVTVKVADVGKQGSPFHADFLVDTGAVDCMAPRDKLEAAGIQVEGKQIYETATGATVEYEVGFARFTVLGDQTISKVIFGPAGCEPLLGVLALEGLGLVVDPLTQELRRLKAIPLKLNIVASH
ncbi:MAG: aspartyl protease family protein [Gemmataceae bacterium]